MELQKRLGDGEGRLKQQQALYEAVRADRNMYSKSLIEAQVSWPPVLWFSTTRRGNSTPLCSPHASQCCAAR